MKKHNYDLYQEVLSILGKEKLTEVIDLVGNQKFSFAKCKRLIKDFEIIKDFESETNFKAIAKKHKTNTMRIYRVFKFWYSPK